MIYISFLIPVYNQPKETRECISAIIKYTGTDIEIVVNDNNSSEDIEGVVKEFHDERIVYYKNDENYGLDGNILAGIERCRGEFVFLTRTTDYVISDAIPQIIEIIQKNKSVVYITGTCVDDDGIPRKILKEGIVQRGKDALQAHWELHFHPSGSLFRKEYIEVDLYKKYWMQYEKPQRFFMVEQLLRLRLASLGDFYFLQRPIWVYTYTNRKVQKSVINNKPYDQVAAYYRYRSEQEFIMNEFDDELCAFRQIKSLEMWMHTVTWSYLRLMNDEGLCKHYGIVQEAVDVEYERKEFLRFVAETERKLQYGNLYYFQNKERIVEANVAFAQIYKKELLSREKAYNAAKDAVELLEEMNVQNVSIKDLLKRKGYKKIGIYGVGYLGRLFYVFLHEKGINPTFITDKKFDYTMRVDDNTKVIPTAEITKYEIDVLVITPVQFYDEIVREIGRTVNMETVIELFDINKKDSL